MIFNKQELVIASHPDGINEVVKMVEEISDEFNINHTYFGNILVAVTEAVKNAITHGNHNDPAKKVHILFEPGPTGLSFTIEDEGEGFDFNHTVDPTETEDTKAHPAKKGLYLIRTLADTVQFTGNGNGIRFGFSVSSINYELSVNRAKALGQYFNPAGKKVSKDLN